MAAGALPRGRHALTREEVVADQRLRMMSALASAMAEKGYVATTVADVLRRAGVSRETFYQQFADKEDAFLQTFDTAAALLLLSLGGLEPGTGTRIEHFDAVCTAYLEHLADQPQFARLFLVESYAAGPVAIERRAAVQARIAAALAELVDARTDAERFACQAIVAAVATLVTAPLLAGDTDAVLALRAPVVDLAATLLR